jgi:hypothetical protein
MSGMLIKGVHETSVVVLYAESVAGKLSFQQWYILNGCWSLGSLYKNIVKQYGVLDVDML